MEVGSALLMMAGALMLGLGAVGAALAPAWRPALPRRASALCAQIVWNLGSRNLRSRNLCSRNLCKRDLRSRNLCSRSWRRPPELVQPQKRCTQLPLTQA